MSRERFPSGFLVMLLVKNLQPAVLCPVVEMSSLLKVVLPPLLQNKCFTPKTVAYPGDQGRMPPPLSRCLNYFILMTFPAKIIGWHIHIRSWRPPFQENPGSATVDYR